MPRAMCRYLRVNLGPGWGPGSGNPSEIGKELRTKDLGVARLLSGLLKASSEGGVSRFCPKSVQIGRCS